MLTEVGNAAIRVGITEALLYVCRPSIAAGCLAQRSGHESAPDALVFMMIMHDDCTAAWALRLCLSACVFVSCTQ